jgi:putative membrane protein
MWSNHWMFGGTMWVFWLLLIVAIVVLVWSLMRREAGTTTHKQDDAIEILKRRYAQGEISRNEFEEKKRDLAPSS